MKSTPCILLMALVVLSGIAAGRGIILASAARRRARAHPADADTELPGGAG